MRVTRPDRCPGAHARDESPCDGPADAVRVVDQHGAEQDACVNHGSALLASLKDARVMRGSVEGAAIEAFRRAQQRTPFDFLFQTGRPRVTSPDTSTASPHAGAHLVGNKGSFQLRYSDQANIWNEARHEDVLTGHVVVAYDSMVVVDVAGWRWAHTVPAARVSEALLACGCPPFSGDGHQTGPGCPAYDGPCDARMEA